MSTIRSIEVAVTKEFSGATPVWTNATIYLLTDGTTQITIPALGATKYAARYRKQDVYGQFSDWSTHTEHTTTAGADSLNATTATAADQAETVLNSTATVTIDASGLTITDGALFIEDEFGRSTLGASGFEGSWSEFINFGLYNGGFEAGTVGTIPNGRTTALPYWTVSDAVGAPTLSLVESASVPDTHYLKTVFAALGNKKKVVSDWVPVTMSEYWEYGVLEQINRVAGTVTVRVGVELSNDQVSVVSFSEVTNAVSSGSGISPAVITGGVTPTSTYRFARVYIQTEESVTHSASNFTAIAHAFLRRAPYRVQTVEVLSELNIDNDSVSGSPVLEIFDDNRLAFGSTSTTDTPDVSMGSGGDGILNVKQGDGTDALGISGVQGPIRRVYTGNATWTKPTGLHHAEVEVIGGGGGGGSTAATGTGERGAAGGGGGGGYAKKMFLASALPSTCTVTRGAGGAGGTSGGDGSAGGTSSLSGTGITTVQATGGSGGQGHPGSTGEARSDGGAGGAGSGGDVSAEGSDGGNATVVSNGYMATGFGGAAASYSGGQRSIQSGVGQGGKVYGGGGSGAVTTQNQAARAGGAGANGVVIVTEYYGP